MDIGITPRIRGLIWIGWLRGRTYHEIFHEIACGENLPYPPKPVPDYILKSTLYTMVKRGELIQDEIDKTIFYRSYKRPRLTPKQAILTLIAIGGLNRLQTVSDIKTALLHYGYNLSNIKPTLARMVEKGLLISEKRNTRVFYALNPRFCQAPSVKSSLTPGRSQVTMPHKQVCVP